MEIVIGTIALIIGLILGGLVAGRLKLTSMTNRHVNCHMCGRPADGELVRWRIRGKSMQVCDRCHPFYKSRFAEEVHDDTHSFSPDSEEKL